MSLHFGGAPPARCLPGLWLRFRQGALPQQDCASHQWVTAVFARPVQPPLRDGAHRGRREARVWYADRDRQVKAAEILSIVGIVVLALRNRRRGNRMNDPGRQGPTADTAPKVRRRRLREHIARLLADMAGRLEDSYADLNQRLDIRTKELSEALEQQTATSEILRVISSSPTDVQPVFDTIAQSAARLCKAQFCHVFRFDGELMHFAASHGLTPEGIEAARQDQACERLMNVPGIGPIISSAMVAAIGTGDAFSKGRDFGAWLGLVPKQISTGDRTILGSISKRGNRYLRALFVQAAWVVLVKLGPKQWERYGLRSWIEAAKKRLHHNVLAVALANKLARIAWAVLHNGRAFECVKTDEMAPRSA